MLKALVRWLIPGVVVVIGGTALTVLATASDMATDVSARSAAAITGQGHNWAELTVDARDIVLRGTVSSRAELEATRDRLLALSGVRSVQADVTIAPLARPYRFSARIDHGQVTLQGGVPDLQTRDRLVASLGAGAADLQLHSGLPPRSAWVAATNYALDQLQRLDQGQVTLTDLQLSIAGSARSDRSYGDALSNLNRLPAGVTLSLSAIQPPLAAPYEWAAQSDGRRIFITGFVPDAVLVDRYHTSEVGGLQVATGLSLASGAPENFADASQILLRNLARLDYGAATIIDTHRALTGSAPNAEIAQAIVDDVKPTGAIVVLEPPKVADFHLSGSIVSGGGIAFEGNVPDEVTRQYLTALPKANVGALVLARGGPDRFQSAVEFAIAAATGLSQGRFDIRQGRISVQGVANSAASYQQMLGLRQSGAPQGFQLAALDVLPPRAELFLWKATKAADGKVSLSGYVPDAKARADLVALIRQIGTDTTTLASGEPGGFVALASIGLTLMNSMSVGSLTFDGTGWTLSGQARDARALTTLKAAFVAQNLAGAGWTLAINETDAKPVSPYIWSAARGADGVVTLAGALPTKMLRAIIAARIGTVVTDTTRLDPAAPQGFTQNTLAGVDALSKLAFGRVAFDGRQWSISGQLPAGTIAADIDKILAAAATPAASWRRDLAVAPPGIAAPPKVPAGPPAIAATPPIQTCRTALAAFAQNDAIAFQSGAAVIKDESRAALDTLARDLALCPGTVVEIEGHTDADGDANANLALSVARAEAVIDALVARNIVAARLYAIGYGEAMPIAGNDTEAGKKQNRRIVITVLDRHY